MDSYGTPDVLKLKDVATPTPKADHRHDGVNTETTCWSAGPHVSPWRFWSSPDPTERVFDIEGP